MIPEGICLTSHVNTIEGLEDVQEQQGTWVSTLLDRFPGPHTATDVIHVYKFRSKPQP